MVEYKIKKGQVFKYYGAGLFYKVIKAYNLKFPFLEAREFIRNLIDKGYIERIKKKGRIRYRALVNFTIPLISWKEYNYTYTFVATRPVKVKIIKIGDEEKKVMVMRKIEVNFNAIAPSEPEDDIKDKIAVAVEKVVRENDYGFIYDEVNLGSGDSWKISDAKKPRKFIGNFNCYDHTYKRSKASESFELPSDWWEMGDDELAEWMARYIKFELMRRGRK